MHLLLAQKGTINDGNEAIDLGQTPGDILFLSAADTELASLAQANKLVQGGPSLRLANFLSLTHPMSVDSYVERTARHAKLIVVRIIGGETYWPYGLEALHASALAHGAKIAVLPGDDKPDHGLDRFSNVSIAERKALWHYLIEGGTANTIAFLSYCTALVSDSEKPEEAAPLLKAGLWWPGDAVSSLDGIQRHWPDVDAPVAAIIFYRALVQSGQTQPVEALIEGLKAQGLNPLPIFVSSLKDRLSAAVVDGVFEDCAPDIVLNATGFAISSPGAERKPTVLDKRGNMVLQVIFSGTPKAVWETSQQGLLARDLAMNVALPEVDGRVLSRAVSFKSAKQFDASVEANIVTHEPDESRVSFVAELAARWVRLRRKKAQERRIALILANYPNRDGRLGNGVGLDTPAGTVEVLRAMKGEGYAVGDIPADSDALMRQIMAGPTNAARDGREIRETISLNQYKRFFETLPSVIQTEVTTRWGAPENDPYFANELDAFALPLMRFGETHVGIQPARGYNIDPKETYHSPDLVPPHGYIAFYAYLREVAAVDAIVHMGKHGNLEWLPGKALALSQNCYPEAVFGPMPHVYPFIV
ncbi:MAG TPA: cobaltochelatase subunit CobN, partial [Ochrobactrum sp.]|nr:cobaltochelatase subunit CobN [Ochrobactrum sp.]